MNNAGIYVRYSATDTRRDNSISRSIQNQKEILEKYAIDNNFNIYKTYSDYNYTGTNMERPALKELIKDAALGKINIIIVKDLSRFGRNYREVGTFIDKIFPILKIRFISVNDNYDSFLSNDEMTVAIKNYINYMYSQDLKKKMKKSLMLRAQEKPLLTYKYGYIIKKSEISIDKEAAPIIKKIFELAKAGMKPHEIANFLNDKKILSPLALRKKQRGDDYKDKQYKWESKKITRILNDTSYIGKFINFKIDNNDPKTKYRDTSMAIEVPILRIIDDDLFYSAPKSFVTKSNKEEIRKAHLHKLILCKECSSKNQHFIYPTFNHNSLDYYCYKCHRKFELDKFENKIYKALVKDLKEIIEDKEEYIKDVSKELNIVNTYASDAINICNQMRYINEKFARLEISYTEYQKTLDMLADKLVNSSVNNESKTKIMTKYTLRNNVLLFLNSIDFDTEDKLKFIKDNVLEIEYYHKTNSFKFIYPFMR